MSKVKTAPPGRYGDGLGLYLLVRPPKEKKAAAPQPPGEEESLSPRFWLFRYTRNGKMREMGLGPASGQGAVSLTKARAQARGLHEAVRDGRDPLADRDAARLEAKAEAQRVEARRKTFRDVANAYIAAHEATWRNAKHRQQWGNTLDQYAFPKIGDLPVGEVDTGHVMTALEPIWRVKPETASRLRGRIESVLDYATARGWRAGENPARWRGHVENMLPARAKVAKVEHHPALPWQQIGGFMAVLRAEGGIAARALELTILTAARTSEALNACWREIDLDEAVWTVPAGRMKAGREHRVPLAPAAVALLQGLLPLRVADQGDWVFPGGRRGRPLSNMAMLMLLRRMKRGDLTAHGFRSAFRDWAAESTSHPREVAEQALAHTLSDKVEAAYRRGDLFEKRRRLMEDWAAFCAQAAVNEEAASARAAS